MDQFSAARHPNTYSADWVILNCGAKCRSEASRFTSDFAARLGVGETDMRIVFSQMWQRKFFDNLDGEPALETIDALLHDKEFLLVAAETSARIQGLCDPGKAAEAIFVALEQFARSAHEVESVDIAEDELRLFRGAID